MRSHLDMRMWGFRLPEHCSLWPGWGGGVHGVGVGECKRNESGGGAGVRIEGVGSRGITQCHAVEFGLHPPGLEKPVVREGVRQAWGLGW